MLRWSEKTRFAIIYPLVVLLFIMARTNERTMTWGILFIGAGEALRIWANGYVGHNKVNRTRKDLGAAPIGSLVTAGPYAFIRHPLYAGTLLIAFGLCVAISQLWLSIPALIALFLIYRKKMIQEDRLLRDECGLDHEEYFRSVPRLAPNGTIYATRQGSWSFRGIAASKEWKTLLWLVILFLLLYFREEWFQEREFFTPEKQVKQALLLGLMLLLILGDVGYLVWRRFARRAA